MKTAVPHPQHHLAGTIRANLAALRHAYAHQLSKPLTHSLEKLSRRFARVLKKHAAAYRGKATREIARYLVATLGNSFSQGPATPHAPAAKRKKRVLS